MAGNGIKIFFDSNIVLGSAQLKLLDEPQLSYYAEKGLLKKPEIFVNSKALIERVLQLLDKKVNIEPFISRKVKEEVKRLLTLKALENKILKPLKVDDKITKMDEADKKIFEAIVYQIFIIKLPIYVDDIVDNFSVIRVDSNECNSIRDDIYNKVYRPLLPTFSRLVDKFELSGISVEKLKIDVDYIEYTGLFYNLRSLRDRSSSDPKKYYDYKRVTDLLILAEAVYSYNKMLNEYKEAPIFYFVSNDTICLSISKNGFGGVVFDRIPKLIKSNYGIITLDSKHMFQLLSSY